MHLSKTDFIQYLNCPKSLWLLKHKPKLFTKTPLSNYEEKLAAEGYKVQALVENYLREEDSENKYSSEQIFKTKDGLYVAADIIRHNNDGTLDLFEVKSSSSISNENLIDATFQMLTIEKSGSEVNSIHIVHINKNYVRGPSLSVGDMMSFSLVTNQVRRREKRVNTEIMDALEFLKQPTIDETNCSCLKLSGSHHCESFDYFNPNIPKPSIYNLPRINKKRLAIFSEEQRFDLNEIDDNEVTKNQLRVVKAAKSNSPVINRSAIKNFYEKVQYPLYFLDYETFSSAIPVVEGVKPHAHIPFQFSIHVMAAANIPDLQHFEYLAENAELPQKMVEYMQEIIGPTGSIVSWHKSFENTRNKEMAALYPDKAEFLNSISDRTIDLEDMFKDGYVDIAFGGSTSIKKVLPVIVPDLSYDKMEVANGTDAMEFFTRMLNSAIGYERKKLRHEMLKYCKLDTLAMVKIFEAMKKYM